MQTMPIAALIYDFDLTLSPRYMQEYAYLPGIRMDPPEFWGACRDFQEANQVDGVLAYMYMVVEKAKGVMELTRGTFHRGEQHRESVCGHFCGILCVRRK